MSGSIAMGNGRTVSSSVVGGGSLVLSVVLPAWKIENSKSVAL